MATVNKYKGDDIPVTIGLTDDEGNDINIDNLVELYVYIIHVMSGEIISFNKAGSGDHIALRKVTTISYIADWLSGSTKDAATGKYIIEINIVESDANYESSKKNTLASDPIIKLLDTKIKTESSG